MIADSIHTATLVRRPTCGRPADTGAVARISDRTTRTRRAESLRGRTADRACMDAATRERMLAEHLGLVHHVARQIRRTLSTETELDELISAGTVGLMQAWNAFDAERGLAFSTFAAPRIRGAILDDLRRQDHVPRSVRRKQRELASARESLRAQLNREPAPREVADFLSVGCDTLHAWQAAVEGAQHVPLDAPLRDSDRRSPAPADLLADEAASGAEDRITHREETRLLRDAILRLKEQERIVLSLYYFEELKLHQIAGVLGLTESRVSQIRSKALGRLRVEMAPLRQG